MFPFILQVVQIGLMFRQIIWSELGSVGYKGYSVVEEAMTTNDLSDNPAKRRNASVHQMTLLGTVAGHRWRESEWLREPLAKSEPSEYDARLTSNLADGWDPNWPDFLQAGF